MNGKTNWKSTKVIVTCAGMLICALTLIAGVIVLPILKYAPISDWIAVALIGGIFGNSGLYNIVKWRQNVNSTNNSNGMANGYSQEGM